MGNQLAGIAPSQIYPVEHYLTELPDVTYEMNLGSTRFFKVAKVKHREGLAVVKVFAIHDPTLHLKTHKETLEKIKVQLVSVPNCLPYQKQEITEKAGILIRQYIKDNLYDRISTRPFLNSVEKRWIAFQLLSAIAQCHQLGVCHGDIKLENIMVTGWNWILLTDFASFKPTYLPEDNPADFSYYFDTSRRRVCYIAPERFVKTLNPDSVVSHFLPEEGIRTGELTPAMDIFSLGCVFTELFTEGHPPFDFSQLLAYRSGEYSPWKILDKIEDTALKELIRHMIQKDPTQRLSAEEYLQQQKGKVFPVYFYSFLRDYMKAFATKPILVPDEKISKLRQDIQAIFHSLTARKEDDNEQYPSLIGENINGVNNNSGLLIIVALLTSCLRALKRCSAKLQALELIRELTPYLTSDIILDRLLPYMLCLVDDKYPLVRAETIETLTHCLTLVRTVPRSDANIFPEYILPNLAHVTQDSSTIVRKALAENIAVLAETALRFLEIIQLEVNAPDTNSSDSGSVQAHHHYQASYDSELQALHEMIQQSVSTLLSDSQNIVKQTLLEIGITRLCVFFGRQKANDVLLSHMITFLNDKEDRHLRGAFFDSIVGIAAYVGWQCSPILKPLLQQGLADPEEFVISKTLSAMTDLAEMGLFRKQMLYELTAETVPLLIHPSLWIRQFTVGFVCAVTKCLTLADVECKLKPMLQPFLKHPVVEVEKEVVLLSSIEDPLPRPIFDFLVKFPKLPPLLESLRDRKVLRSIVRVGHQPSYSEMDHSLKSVYRRLQSDGMNESIEDKILAMKDHLLKIQKYKKSLSESRNQSFKHHDGIIELDRFKNVLHVKGLHQLKAGDEALFLQGLNKKNTKKKGALTDLAPVTMNEEWQHMFGSVEPRSPASKNQSPAGDTNASTEAHVSGAESAESAVPSLNTSPKQVVKPLEKFIIAEGPFRSCQQELRLLTHKKSLEFARENIIREAIDNMNKDDTSIPHKWRPRGTLVAHMHEHRGAIHRLQVIPETHLFATCSADGTVKIWDWGRMETKSYVNRSRLTYARMDGQVMCLTVCQGMQSLAAASDAGSIHVFKLEQNTNKMVVLNSRSLDPHEDGCVVDINHFDTGIQSVLAYATVYGSIIGWDLRAPGTAWKLENDPRLGLITSFCVDPEHCWLVVGTVYGKLICWDMRFQLPITTVSHPSGARIRRVNIYPSHQSGVLASVQGNNEVSMWNMETGSRDITLWASNYPPLSETLATNSSVYSMYMSPAKCGPFLLTAGSDMRLRYWDLASPLSSYSIAGAATDVQPLPVTYRSNMIDGTTVIQEVFSNQQRPPANAEEPKRYPEMPSAGHHDCISDLGVIHTGQSFIISTSKNGVVKVWK